MDDDNTANGFQALANNTTGSFNIGLGRGAGSGVATADDVEPKNRGRGSPEVNYLNNQ